MKKYYRIEIQADKLEILQAFVTWLSECGEQYLYEDNLYSDDICIDIEYSDGDVEDGYVITLKENHDKREME